MTASVITCNQDDDIADVMATMREKKIRHIPVVEDGKLRAMLSVRDFDDAFNRMRAQARTDELTGVANKRHFTEILDNEFNRFRMFRTPLSVMVIDVDKFAQIKETHGTAAGDMVLAAIAELLTRESRAFDGIGRTGTDRFAMVFPSTDLARAQRACKRMFEQITRLSVSTENGQIPFTVSVGLTIANAETRDGSSLMMRASELLKEAKHGGRNRIAVDAAAEQDDDAEPGRIRLAG